MTSDLTLRPATADDAADVFDLVAARDLAELGELDLTLQGVSNELAQETSQSWVATRGEDPRLVGYCVVNVRPGAGFVDAGVVVRLGEPPTSTGTLLHHVRRAAAAAAPDRPVHTESSAEDAVTSGVYERAGGVLVRHFRRMVIELGEVMPEPPAAGAGVDVRVVGDDDVDLHELHRVLTAAFAEHFGSAPSTYDVWLERLRQQPGADPSMRWFATVDGEPAAAVVATRLNDDGYIPVLGVLEEARGRGLGRLLLLTAFRGLHERGMRRAILHVDASNPTGAVELYTSAGMTPHHDYAVHEFPPLT